MRQLEGRVTVVTGASSGIGRAIAEVYASEGASVALVARSEDKLEALAKSIAESGGKAIVVAGNVCAEADVVRIFDSVVEAFGRVDVLVNNAGVTTRLATVDLPVSEWQHVIDVNVTGAFLCAREALRLMKRQMSGRIINIGSVAAKAPRPDSIAYTTSKAALEGMTRSLAIDAREFGVGVCIIQPGNTMSALWTQRADLAAREGIMDAREVGRVAAFVASMPADINIFEVVVHPLAMPWIGRG